MTKILAVLMFATTMMYGADKKAYDIGVFRTSISVSDGVYGSYSGGYSDAYTAGHNVHIIQVPDGVYFISAPTNVGISILASVATNGHAPTIHKQWFMDDLHDGDNVLFSAKCNKHWNCSIQLPNPDNPNKIISTVGRFKPNVAQTNTSTSLCGTGKLTPAAEAQLCSTRK